VELARMTGKQGGEHIWILGSLGMLQVLENKIAMWYLFLAVAVRASNFPTPYPTAPSYTDLLHPGPTPATLFESQCHELDRRDTTSAAEASICGYYERSKSEPPSNQHWPKLTETL
jgi:hypothetical protein